MAVSSSSDSQNQRPACPWPPFTEQDVESVLEVVGREEFDKDFITAAFIAVSAKKGRNRVEEIVENVFSGLNKKSITQRCNEAREQYRQKVDEYEREQQKYLHNNSSKPIGFWLWFKTFVRWHIFSTSKL